MQYVSFFGHSVSKLIVGDNPINGYSYIGHRIPGKEMADFYTTEKIKETLFHMEELGYNTMLPLLFGKGSYGAAKRRAKAALRAVGLEALAHKKANQLSGGQRQRVAIARALAGEPELLLADEPTGQLDSATGKEIMELLADCNRRGITVILVTHDDTVASYARRFVLLSDGKIVSDTGRK